MEFPCTSPENQGRAKALEGRIIQASARAHAAMAQVVLAAAEFDEIGAWCTPGIRSFPHWLAIEAGFDPRTGSHILRIGQALKSLPRISTAFAEGRLSFDKVLQIITVASPATEEMFLDIALGASGSQLERICRSLRRIAKAKAADHDERRLAERGLWSTVDEEGMVRLVAKLPSEDGAVVMAALERLTGSRPLPEQSDGGVEDPAEDPWGARRADALVALCEHILAGGAEGLVSASATRQVVVHVDIGVLTGESPEGRAYIDGIAPLSAEAARRISCDAEIVAVIEKDGLPVDAGRSRRLVSGRLRRALEARDQFCRFPGCATPARRTQAHHIEHWATGGPTNLDNVLLLCSFHHHRHHDGGYLIHKMTGGGIQFETHDGHVIGSALPHASSPKRNQAFPSATPRAEWGGERMDFDHTIWVLTHNSELLEARAGPAN